MSSPAEKSTPFASDFSVLAASPAPDRSRRIARTEEYPKEVWYFLASFVCFLLVCRGLSWAFKKVRKYGSAQLKPDQEIDTLYYKTVIRWRRLPSAIMNFYRILAFRLVFMVGGYSLNLAEVALTLLYIVVLFTWAFVNTTNLSGIKLDPNYWSNRCGALVASQLPLITALGTKNSVFSLITGISFEKLNYLHRMAARVVFVLLCVHVGSKSEGMHMNYLYTVTLYWILLIGAYLHTRAFHFDAYVWPSFVVWGLDRLTRVIRLLVFNGFEARTEVLDASVELISAKLVRLTVKRPPHFRWSPGQTAFLVIPSVSALPFEAHPFTIASYDSGLEYSKLAASSLITDSSSKHEAKDSEVTASPLSFWKELVFLVNVREGLTRRLAERASETDTIRIYVDGPYGSSPDVISYDTSVLVAGGSGVSFTVPLFLNTIEQVRKGKSRCRRVIFLWCIRSSDDLQWISEPLYNALLLAPSGLEIVIDIFITRFNAEMPSLTSNSGGTATPDESSLSSSKKDLSQDLNNSTSSLLALGVVRTFNGRPDLSAYLQEQAELAGDGHMGVAVCGSQSIANAVRKGLSFSVAGPHRVLRGGVSVTLHVETFGYA
ncbi:hypothetical protein E1B28_005810 [Marasmius oreades]|uniref:ferric-chelate reductase (NADPH) n=1 Tax=Marasmius oreades TaxID=181124 RepID=A0A9P7S5E3_9AGAR|nr:uncharacterized protein E1B28_005810 [Marasmius oreades]KAG7095016.1 hypothetical protein E1B28_005810 [Marasmius oreades]